MLNGTSIGRLLSVLGVAGVLSGCGTLSPSVADPFAGPEADTNSIRIYVQNANFYDANLYAITSGGPERRLGTVGGKQDAVFNVPWTFSQDLQVRIDLIAGPTCTTERIPVDPGDMLEVQILSGTDRFC